MRRRGGSARRRAWLTAALVAAGLLITHRAWAYISQVDGTVVPQTTRMQQCLDRPGTGETAAGAVDAVADAAVLPEAYRPVEDPAGSGSYPVTFSAIGEGAGYRNSFGWYWTDEDPSDPANLHTVFGCRPVSAACSCPCDPEDMRPGGAWQTTLDFSTQPGFAPGRAIGFWLRSPERIDGSGNDSDNCGNRTDTANRIYFTSKALNDDGDYVHFLVYRSATRLNTYYFGFEDLFRGGDNDFEDMLVRASGLVPLCDPQPETCNGADDDCDLAVDEGVTTGCSTDCGSGIRECVGGSFGACSAPEPTAESCNGMDDDCDGSVDEGLSRACSNECGTGTELCSAGSWVDCTAPTPGIETCNDADDDCDSLVDEGITRACFAACGSGTETCVAGAFVGCDAPTPSTETCNGTDDDCDGLTDEGLTRACSTACGDGTETCISGSYVGCTAPDPSLEACNGADDDCDGTVDEGLTRTCSTACGTGTETCVEGAYVGCDAPTPAEEVCNNVDDDCNGVIDDGNPGGGDACLPDDEGGYTVVDPDAGGEDGVCIPGRVRCVAGELECLGASSPTREICNCEDDDCDGEVDEDVTGSICPGGACIGCTCASPCEGEEFPCPPGRECDESLAVPDEGIIGYCVPGMCAGVECTDEEVCDPSTGECTNLCEGRTCPDGTVCVRGGCVEDNCYGRGCEPGERCRMGECEPDPCIGVTCDDGEYCRDGDCVLACTTPCSALERCVDGECVPSGCSSSCGSSSTCVDGECVPDDCETLCGRGRACIAGECVDDPCQGIECPGGTVCDRGACITEGEVPEPEDASYGLATGGGGCVCSAAGAERSDGTGAAGGLLALAGLLVLVGWRRRWRLGRGGLPALAVASVVGLGPVNAGCEVDPFCFEDCDEPADAGPADSGVADARPADGCVVSGEELCNGIDDDCNGIVDDGFDLERDPRNCGECGNECVLPQAFPDCEVGECAIARCEIGWHDLDGNPTNGCEYECPPSGSEICDDRDNDCDGATDEGFDLDADLAHCGECGNLCSFPNASAMCEGGTCSMGDCNAGFVDLDGDADTGCEYACTPTGAETCNSVDDDCDGMVDEGFDLATDPSHCGVCGRTCTFPNATGECVAGVCGIASCAAGFVDVDGDPATGCEYGCSPTGSADTCNGVDDDCDGAVDESDPDVGSSCGSATGACELGVQACQFGSLVCVGGRGPTGETCNSVDDDCDGTTDESTAGSPIPGVGVRCGETNEGACEYGSVVCTGGALVCGGGYIPPATETCNGIDDDCDGAVDDSPTPPTSTPASCTETAGVCAGRTPACNGAAGWQCSFPPTYQPTETLCDGLNNDCDVDGIDEGCLFPGPGGDVRVDRGDTAGSNNSVQPVISGDGASRVYAAWMDLRGGSGRSHILFNRSTNGGDTWGASPTTLDAANGAAIGPALAVTGATRDDISAVWADFRGGSSYREIYQSFSTDFGASWDANTRINPGQNVDSFNIDLAAQGSNVYVVYESFSTPRTRHVFIARSPDGGDTWGAPQQVDTGVGSTFVAATPKIAAAGGFVHVTWRDNRSGALDVFYRRAAAMGTNSVSFGASEVRMDVGTAAGAFTSFSPVVAAEGANVYVAWVDDRSGSSFDIHLNRSNDSGASWLVADSVLLDDDPIPHDSIEPRIVAPSSGTAIVSWIDYRYGFPDILVSRTTDGGSGFSSPVRVDTGTANGTSASLDLALGANGDLVVATWADDRDGFFDIYANFSLDGGATWQPSDYRMDSTAIPGSSDSVRPEIYVAPAAAHILWVDHRNGASADIYYRRLD